MAPSTVGTQAETPVSAADQELRLAREALNTRPSDRNSYAAGLKHGLNVLEISPGHTEAAVVCSDLYLKLSRLNDAIKVLEAAYAVREPGSEALAERIAWLYSTGGAHERAVDWYETALGADPSDPNIRNGYVNALIRVGRFNEAREWVDAPALRALITLHMAAVVLRGSPEEDVTPLVEEANPGIATALPEDRIDAAMLVSNLAVLYAGDDESIAIGFYRTAIAWIEPVVDRVPDRELVWSLLADLYEQVGDEENATRMRDYLRDLNDY